MVGEFRSSDLNSYVMDYYDPHRALESVQRETAVVDRALLALHNRHLLPSVQYDHDRFLLFREAVQKMHIPWTAITPRMQRLLYAINAIRRPKNVVCCGIFCGNTFAANIGAAVGPGAVYSAERMIGVEINATHAKQAQRNIKRLESKGLAEVVTGDACEVVHNWKHSIDILYLDVDKIGDDGHGKDLYLSILQAGYRKLSPGGLVLAHNSCNAAEKLKEYLQFVRNEQHFQDSMNVILDNEGLEVSAR